MRPYLRNMEKDICWPCVYGNEKLERPMSQLHHIGDNSTLNWPLSKKHGEKISWP